MEDTLPTELRNYFNKKNLTFVRFFYAIISEMKIRNIIIITILIVSGGLYQYRDFFWPGSPCTKTIEFSIGTLDPRFGISQAQFISKIEQAGGIWNSALKKNIFKYSVDGDLKINLIYDSRQQMTDELKKQGVVIDDNVALYDSLKVKYDALVSSYNTLKVSYEKDLASFQIKQDAFNETVSYWNNKGGAGASDYKALNKDKANLELLLQNLNKTREKLNLLNEQVNTYVPILNTLVHKLNLKVADYNNIGSVNGDEYSEGEYILDSSGERINIYQFENNTQLIRVLTHELCTSFFL